MNKLQQIINEEITNLSLGFVDTNMDLPGERLEEDLIVKPDIPNTMSFYHGGNLDRYDDSLSQKKGRYQYGAGLYLTTHYGTAEKYAKGSRKMYMVTVAKGNDIQYSSINVKPAIDFVNNYTIASKRKEILYYIDKYKTEDTIKAYIFNNLLINHDAIKPSNTKALRDFWVDNNIDYEIIYNAFGWGEDMMVLFNMYKIVQSIIIKPKDTIKDYLINN